MSAEMVATSMTSGLTRSFVEKIIDAIFEDVIRGLAMEGKLKLAEQFGAVSNIVNYAYDMLSDAEPDPITGITAKGLTESVIRFLEASALSTIFVGEEIAEEFFGEMIQEAFSNAVQYNIGGAVQTIGNIWKGSYPINPDEIVDVIRNAQYMDEDTKLLLMAMAGANIPVSWFYGIRGYNQWLDQELSGITEQLTHIAMSINDLAFTELDIARRYSEDALEYSYVVKEEMAEKLLRTLEQSYDRAIARLQEILSDAYLVKFYYDSGNISEDSMKQQAVLIELERQSIMTAVDQIENGINEILDNLDNYITNAGAVRQYARYIFGEYAYHLSKSVSALTGLNDEAYNEFQDLHNAVTRLTAYRMYRFGKTYINSPIAGNYEDGNANVPEEPEEPTIESETATTGE